MCFLLKFYHNIQVFKTPLPPLLHFIMCHALTNPPTPELYDVINERSLIHYVSICWKFGQNSLIQPFPMRLFIPLLQYNVVFWYMLTVISLRLWKLCKPSNKLQYSYGCMAKNLFSTFMVILLTHDQHHFKCAFRRNRSRKKIIFYVAYNNISQQNMLCFSLLKELFWKLRNPFFFKNHNYIIPGTI